MSQNIRGPFLKSENTVSVKNQPIPTIRHWIKLKNEFLLKENESSPVTNVLPFKFQKGKQSP